VAIDLNDFAGVTEAELRAEARRRGVSVAEGAPRKDLVTALRSRPRGLRRLLGRVVDTVLRSPAHRGDTMGSAIEPRARQIEPERGDAARMRLADPDFAGVLFVDGPEGVSIVWRVGRERIEGAQAAGAGGELRLRTVRVRWIEGDEPTIAKDDHGAVWVEGALALGECRPGERIVAALGLGAGGEFVAIDHATHA
jgi:hypothetical protein